eukprot:s700_g14.t1
MSLDCEHPKDVPLHEGGEFCNSEDPTCPGTPSSPSSPLKDRVEMSRSMSRSNSREAIGEMHMKGHRGSDFHVTVAEREWEKVTVDEATRMRLNGESAECMAHMKAMKKAGGVSLKEADGADTSKDQDWPLDESCFAKGADRYCLITTGLWMVPKVLIFVIPMLLLELPSLVLLRSYVATLKPGTDRVRRSERFWMSFVLASYRRPLPSPEQTSIVYLDNFDGIQVYKKVHDDLGRAEGGLNEAHQRFVDVCDGLGCKEHDQATGGCYERRHSRCFLSDFMFQTLEKGSAAPGSLSRKAWKAMASKGGPRRSSVAPVDIDALQSITDKAVDAKGLCAFKLGDYDTKKIATAVSAKGAHFNVEYVEEIYKISNGEILAGQLKQCILKSAQSHNTSDWKDDLWAGEIQVSWCAFS